MSFPITCPGCRQRLNIPEAAVGKRAKCPSCGSVIAIARPGSIPAESSGRRPDFASIPFLVTAMTDTARSLKGAYQAEINPAGLTLRRKGKEIVVVPIGTPARHLEKSRISVSQPGRELTLAVGQLNLYQERLARDVVSILNGEEVVPDASGYKMPWYLPAAAMLPGGIVAVGMAFGAIGGALGGGLGGGLIAANLGIIKRERWPASARLGACLATSAVGYVLVALVLLAIYWHLHPAGKAAPVEGSTAGQRAIDAPNPPPSAVGMEGLIGYWPFDEGKGEAVADASGNGRPGILTNARWVRGVRGGAVQFDGNGFFDYGASSAFNFAHNEPFTISVWVQTREAGPIVSQRHAAAGSAVIDLVVEDRAVTAVVRQDDNEQAPFSKMSGRDIRDGRWHHLALVRYSGNSVCLWLDGEREQFVIGVNSGGAITTNLRTAGAERYWAAHGGGPPFSRAAIDELCIFKGGLDDKAIQRLAGR